MFSLSWSWSLSSSDSTNKTTGLSYRSVFKLHSCYTGQLMSFLCLYNNSKLLIISAVLRLYRVMVALCNRADHYIFMLWLLLSFFLSFFLALSQRSEIGCLPFFNTWCGPSVNLECRSDTCCTRLGENTGRKKSPKSPSGHHRTTLSGYIFATKAHIDNRKKLVKQQYVLQMSPQYGELRPTSGWDRFVSLGHPR